PFMKPYPESPKAIPGPHSSSSKPHLLAWTILFLLALVWGSSFILIKKGLLVFSPLQTAALRVGSGILILFFIALPYLRRVPSHKWKYLIISGHLGVLIPAFLFAQAQTGLDSSLAGILNSLTPLFTLLIGNFFFQSRLRLFQVLGVGIGLVGSVGLVLVNSPQGGVSLNHHALLVLLATILYGMNVNLVKKYLSDLPPLMITSISLFTTAPLTLGLLLNLDILATYKSQTGAGEALAYISILGVFSTGIAAIFFNHLIQISNAIFASSVTYLIPFIALLWGVLDGESLSFQIIFALSLVIAGVWLVNRK
ncbi:MAG: DMT family transporter, partial [Bacteroidota bacterium]